MSTAFCVGVGLAPGFIASALLSDLGIDRWHIGLLVSLHFGCTGLASVPAGRITERWGARVTVVANLAGITFGLGVAVAGIVGGMIMQTACLSTMYAAVADRAPRAVARATSLTMAGAFLGALRPCGIRSLPGRRRLLRVGLVHPVHAARRRRHGTAPRRLDRTPAPGRNAGNALRNRAADLVNSRPPDVPLTAGSGDKDSLSTML